MPIDLNHYHCQLHSGSTSSSPCSCPCPALPDAGCASIGYALKPEISAALLMQHTSGLPQSPKPPKPQTPHPTPPPPCCSRLAPLSEGRIHESGQLQCTYHGWTFDTTGACSSIPQLGDPKAHATACASSRSCVKSFPVCVDNGLLWVYADSNGPQPSSNSSSGSGSGVEQQQQQQQQLRPPAELLLPEGYQVKSPWFQRDGESHTRRHKQQYELLLYRSVGCTQQQYDV